MKTLLLNLSKLNESDVIAFWPYGSRVYGTNDYHSDRDYIIVHNGDKANDAQQYDTFDKKISTTVYHVDSWKEHLLNQKIFALECQFHHHTSPFEYKLNLPLLRKEISSKASNSWVKCKKKLEVENERRIGIKSLFHSFRIPMFGIQVATRGKIYDYYEASGLWFDEMEAHLHTDVPWDTLKEIYQPRHNALMTEFRKVAEK